jgi:hypothetical protein
MAENSNSESPGLQHPLAAHVRNFLRGNYVSLASQEDLELDIRSTTALYHYRVAPVLPRRWYNLRNRVRGGHNFRALPEFSRRCILLFLVGLAGVVLIFAASRSAATLPPADPRVGMPHLLLATYTKIGNKQIP